MAYMVKIWAKSDKTKGVRKWVKVSKFGQNNKFLIFFICFSNAISHRILSVCVCLQTQSIYKFRTDRIWTNAHNLK